MWLPLAFLVLLTLGAVEPAHADWGDAYKEIGKFEDSIVKHALDVLARKEIQDFIKLLYVVMALALFVVKCVGWGLRGIVLYDVVETLMQILVPAFLLASFGSIVPTLFSGALGIGQALLAGLTGLDAKTVDLSHLPTLLVSMFVNIGKGLQPHCTPDGNPLNVLSCITNSFMAIAAAVVMAIVLAILCIFIMLVDVWGFWLYAIALCIGPVLVPFSMYQRLAFLFDGWVRFFIGTLVYVIVARANLGLVAVALPESMHTHLADVVSGAYLGKPMPPVGGLADVLGILLFCGVGVYTLACTSRFASAIVAGAGAGGVNFGAVGQALAGGLVGAGKTAFVGLKGAAKGMAQARAKQKAKDEARKAAAKAAKEAGKPAPFRHVPAAPGLAFGQLLGGAAKGMAVAYGKAAADAAMKNRAFREGFDGMQKLLHKEDKRRFAADVARLMASGMSRAEAEQKVNEKLADQARIKADTEKLVRQGMNPLEAEAKARAALQAEKDAAKAEAKFAADVERLVARGMTVAEAEQRVREKLAEDARIKADTEKYVQQGMTPVQAEAKAWANVQAEKEASRAEAKFASDVERLVARGMPAAEAEQKVRDKLAEEARVNVLVDAFVEAGISREEAQVHARQVLREEKEAAKGGAQKNEPAGTSRTPESNVSGQVNDTGPSRATSSAPADDAGEMTQRQLEKLAQQLHASRPELTLADARAQVQQLAETYGTDQDQIRTRFSEMLAAGQAPAAAHPGDTPNTSPVPGSTQLNPELNALVQGKTIGTQQVDGWAARIHEQHPDIPLERARAMVADAVATHMGNREALANQLVAFCAAEALVAARALQPHTASPTDGASAAKHAAAPHTHEPASPARTAPSDAAKVAPAQTDASAHRGATPNAGTAPGHMGAVDSDAVAGRAANIGPTRSSTSAVQDNAPGISVRQMENWALQLHATRPEFSLEQARAQVRELADTYGTDHVQRRLRFMEILDAGTPSAQGAEPTSTRGNSPRTAAATNEGVRISGDIVSGRANGPNSSHGSSAETPAAAGVLTPYVIERLAEPFWSDERRMSREKAETLVRELAATYGNDHEQFEARYEALLEEPWTPPQETRQEDAAWREHLDRRREQFIQEQWAKEVHRRHPDFDFEEVRRQIDAFVERKGGFDNVDARAIARFKPRSTTRARYEALKKRRS